ncbi:MAG: response regulator, partial [Bacteriovoracaceae bacterium]|nr:response regulator [Bacteriovoracaceae bacterium]
GRLVGTIEQFNEVFMVIDDNMLPQQKKILVIDDSPPTLMLIERILSEQYCVTTAVTGKDALDQIRQEKFDLITLDISLPDIDGLELCRRIKQNDDSSCEYALHNSEIPVVLVTADDSVTTREYGHAAGGNDFVIKNNLKSDLIFSVNKILVADDRYKGMHVLLVDGMRTARSIMSSYLRAKGVIVMEAHGGDMGYAMVKANINELDMVITSQVNMGMTGVELCRKIRSDLALKDVPVLLVTSSEDRKVVVDFFSVGGSDYLPKTFLMEEINARAFLHLENRYLFKELRKMRNKGMKLK